MFCQKYNEELDRHYSLWQEYNYVYSEWAKNRGLSINSLLVLYALYYTNECYTQKKLSQRWLIPKQTVNKVLKEFQIQGLVKLQQQKEDRRNKAILLTDSGRKYAEPIILELRTLELSTMKNLGIEKMQILNDIMSSYIEIFRNTGDK